MKLPLLDQVWEADDDRVWCPADRTTVAFGPMSDDAAKLVAQAPAMARLLLHIADDSAHNYMSSVGPMMRAKIEAVLRAAGVLDAG